MVANSPYTIDLFNYQNHSKGQFYFFKILFISKITQKTFKNCV